MDYGIIYYTAKDGATASDYVEYECWYVGADRRTVKILELGWWKDKGDYPYVWPMFRDEQDFLYVIFQGAFASLLKRLDKATMTLGFASMPGIIMQTLESAETTADPLLAHEFPSCRTHPRIVDVRPEGMCTITIPAGRYVAFSITGDLDTQQQLAALQKLWQELWSMDLSRTFSCDFEEYRSAAPNRADIRVYIGLK